MYADGQRIAMLTAYDYPTAKLIDEAGVPFILVGDSLGRAELGYDSEIPVTMADMLHHTAAVARGVQRALVVSGALAEATLGATARAASTGFAAVVFLGSERCSAATATAGVSMEGVVGAAVAVTEGFAAVSAVTGAGCGAMSAGDVWDDASPALACAVSTRGPTSGNSPWRWNCMAATTATMETIPSMAASPRAR